MGIWRFIATLSVAALVSGSAAAAEEEACMRLEARLAALEQGGSGNDAERNEMAIAKQQRELDRAIGQARAGGCMGGFLIFQSRRDPRCGSLMASIQRMRANLDRLSEASNRFDGFDNGIERERSEILRALAYNQCGPQYASYGHRSFFDTLFGGLDNGWGGQGGEYPNEHFGTYRTLCVRLCDGYYFPISFSTVESKFEQDQQTCQSMCPASEVALYIHRSPGEDSEAMVSLSGEPYTALPTAFKYRKEYDKACTCGKPAAVAVAPAEPNATPVDPSLFVPPAPLPASRPATSEDPETLANRGGEFVPKPVAPRDNTAPVAGLGPGGKPVRVVGPSSFVTQ